MSSQSRRGGNSKRLCCSCSRASGTCRSCSCNAAGRCCVDCYPGRDQRCTNFGNTNLSVAVVTGGAAGERSLPDAPPESVPGWVPRRGRNTSLSRPQSSATDRSRAALHPGAASSMQSSQSVAAASSMQPLRVDLPALACSEAASIDATDPLSAGASADCAGESRGLRVDLPPVRSSGSDSTTVQLPTHIASAAADPSYADPPSASVASVAAGPVARGRISVGQLDNQSSHVPQVGRSESGPGSNRSGGRSSCGPWSVGDDRKYDIVRTLFDEVVHWKRNIFMLPIGSAGRECHGDSQYYIILQLGYTLQWHSLDSTHYCLPFAPPKASRIVSRWGERYHPAVQARVVESREIGGPTP